MIYGETESNGGQGGHANHRLNCGLPAQTDGESAGKDVGGGGDYVCSHRGFTHSLRCGVTQSLVFILYFQGQQTLIS